MRKILFVFFIMCIVGCQKKIEDPPISIMIKGHLIEESSRKSLSNVKVTLYDDSKIYASAFSNDEGLFSLTTPPLEKNRNYCLSFYWSQEYPSKNITICNPSENLDLKDFIVYNVKNPKAYKVFVYYGNTYMIHNSLPGTYTYEEAKKACANLRDEYSDWVLPPADLLDLIADEDLLAKQVAEEGWYWSSWLDFDQRRERYYCVTVNILENELGNAATTSKNLKVLPVRLIKK